MSSDYSGVRRSPFEISELAAFDKNIEDSSPGEARRKRIAYLKQGLQHVNVGKSMFKRMGCFMVPFMIIPIFWPFLFMMRSMEKRAFGLIDSQVDTALQYWEIDRSEIEQEEQGREFRESF